MFYSAYGLCVQADLPIPGLPVSVAATPPDVRVWLASSLPDERSLLDSLTTGPPWQLIPGSHPDGPPILVVWKDAARGWWLLRYGDGVDFVLDHLGRNVWVSRSAGAAVTDAAIFLLGPVFGLIVRLRGAQCLHASAVAHQGRAFVLLGPPGAGKSTTAAALAQVGCPVLSDDVSVLWDCRSPFLLQPAYPQLRLWPPSVRLLFGADDALPLLTPNWDKRGLDLTTWGRLFQETALPLGGMYLLDARRPQGAPALEEMAAAEGLFALARNTYVNYLLDAPLRAAEFAALGRLLAAVPLKRAVAHEDPAQLPAFLELLLNDFQRVVRATDAAPP